MKHRIGMTIGWICAGLVAALNIFAAIMKYVPQPPESEGAQMMAKLGITPGLEHMLGIVEIVTVVLFLIPRTAAIGLVLMVGYMAGVLATLLTHGMTAFADTAVVYIVFILIMISGYFRTPELLDRVRGKI